MSYDRLIKHLPDLPGQTPRCKGLNRDRFWFSTKTVTECPFYEVQTRGTEYILQAGSIHSITSGLEFSLHAIRDRASNPIGSATVKTVGTITSLIEFSTTPPTNVPPNFFAVQTTFSRANALRLYIEDNPRLARLSGKLQAEIESHPYWYTQTDRENANFEITVKGDTASFAFVNNDIKALGLERLPFRVNLEEEDVIMGVLKAASKFNRHYTNLAPNSGERMDIDEGDRDWDEAGESVSVSLMKLERVRMNSWRPLGPIAMEERLHWKQYVEVVGGNDRYGLEITNNTDQSLYPYLFFFNCNDLSIVPWYMSPTVKGSDQDAPLQPGGVITIGYNGGEGRPWRHIIKPAETTAGGSIIRDAEDMQIDFFKLILTTQPVDFSFIKQETPFNGASKKPLSEDVELVIRESVLLTVVTRKGSTSG
ncbi:hypothetical protein FRC17_008635 [Serendipita sp. 399]|nr:hypothetical protein FRC17_008635 [Serendipita sp. 399]